MGTIFIVDDDIDDHHIYRSVLNELGIMNDIMDFFSAQDAFEFISKKEVFPSIIFSDINMNGMNGFDLKKKILNDPDLRSKCIPFIFLTTGGENKTLWENYEDNVQGLFIKPPSIEEWKTLLKKIMDYWDSSKKPAY
ncbi:MAG: response regulator [Ferruginibacter sp.]